MNRSSNSAAALLQKVSSHLHGDRRSATKQSQKSHHAKKNGEDSDEDIENYLHSVGKKLGTSQKYSSVDNISISNSNDDGSNEKGSSLQGSKFIKKAALSTSPLKESGSTQNKFIKSNSLSANPSANTGNLQSLRTKSSALNKVANLTSKYLKKDAQSVSNLAQLRDSDLELDISTDSDVVADTNARKKSDFKKPVNKEFGTSRLSSKYVKQKIPQTGDNDAHNDTGSNNFEGSRFLKKKSQQSEVKGRDFYIQSSASESEISIPNKTTNAYNEKTPGTNRFLKNKPLTEEPKTSTPLKPTPAPRTFQAKKQELTLDSDEEDLAEFIHGLSESMSPEVPYDRQPVKSTVRVTSLDSESETESSGIGNAQRFIKRREEHISVPVESFSESLPEMIDDVPVEDVLSSAPSTVDSEDSSEGPGIQLMDMDSLLPPKLDDTEEKISPTYSDKDVILDTDTEPSFDKNTGVLGQFGLSTLDDLEIINDSPPAVQTKKSQKKITISKKEQENIGNKTKESNKQKKRTEKQEASLFTKFGLSTLDDIGSEEIKTESESDNDEAVTSRESKSFKYESDFESVPAESPRPKSISSVASVSEIKTASPTKSYYSDNFDDISKSEISKESRSASKTYTSYSDSRSENSYSSITGSVVNKTKNVLKKKKSRRGVSSEDTDYSETHSSVSAISKSSRKSTSRSHSTMSHSRASHRKDKKKSKTVEVQTGEDIGLLYTWNTASAGMAGRGPQIGMSYVDPTPVASHVVSSDALEAMTAYSPSVIVLNDMLRQQLQLTRHFVESQKRLYQSFIDSVDPDYRYTTLEETKEYIRKKRKPRLTFKAALKQVKEEMEEKI